MKRIVIAALTLILVAPAITHGQTWHYTDSMHTERRLHSCVLMPNGKVLVAGGSDENGIALNSAEVYDPSTERWAVVSSMALPRERQATILGYDGKVYVSGAT